MAKPIGYGGRDIPDFGISDTPMSNTILNDLSELSVRLGSGNRFDRLGTQVWNESFDKGIQDWTMGAGGGTSYYQLRADYVEHGGYSLELYADSVAGGTANLQKYLPIPYFATIGYEYHVKSYDPGGIFQISLLVYDGTSSYDLTTQLDDDADEYNIRVSGGGYQTIDISPYHSGMTAPFNAIKFVVDLENRIWRRVMINTIEYDLSEYDLQYGAAVHSPGIFIYSQALGNASDDEHVMLDNMILTVNEPL